MAPSPLGPSAPPPGLAEVAEALGRRSNGKPGVLVVDDSAHVRDLLKAGLDRDGFQVWLAADGREALARYREHRHEIAVVLLDVRMPGLDGPATLDGLRAVAPDVPACFMSGDTGNYGTDELIRRGASCVVAKPFRLDLLAAVLRLLAQGAPAESLVPFGVACPGVSASAVRCTQKGADR